MSEGPLFTALATSTKQLYLLLRAISFTPNANVYITPDGLRITTEEARAIQASTLLDKTLFSSYILHNPADEAIAPFRINVFALLETLQIFGVAETSSSYQNQNGGITSSYAAAFNTPALGLGGTCRISYAEEGAPLSITIEESGVKTTCHMNTYSLSNMYDEDFEIPLDRNALVMKIIMPSIWLHDAVSELASTNSETMLVNASGTSSPYFSLEGHGGPFGDSTVDYAPAAKPDESSGAAGRRKKPQVTETFVVSAPAGSHGRVKQSYKFDLIKKAGRAMSLATKVSIRQDNNGVLSLQFMVDLDSPSSVATAGGGGSGGNGGSGKFSFIDFRFVPLLDDENADNGSDNNDGTNSAGSEDES